MDDTGRHLGPSEDPLSQLNAACALPRKTQVRTRFMRCGNRKRTTLSGAILKGARPLKGDQLPVRRVADFVEQQDSVTDVDGLEYEVVRCWQQAGSVLWLEAWYHDGLLHREGKPARCLHSVARGNDLHEWFHRGMRHNHFGPAIVWGSSREVEQEFWFLCDIAVKHEEWQVITGFSQKDFLPELPTEWAVPWVEAQLGRETIAIDALVFLIMWDSTDIFRGLYIPDRHIREPRKLWEDLS